MVPQLLAQSRSTPASHAASLSPERRRQLERLVWRYGEARPADVESGRATGFVALDRILPQRGWFGDGLNELLGNEQGVGELSLILPALAEACAGGRSIVFVGPPFLPYAPALASAGIALAQLIVVRNVDSEERYWAAEQALRSNACGAVVVWSDEAARLLPDLTLRRLQMAAHAGSCAAFLFRPRRASGQASPAPLRVMYAAESGGLDLVVHKCRGVPGRPRARIQPWLHAWAARPLKTAPSRTPALVHDRSRGEAAPSPAQPRARVPSPYNSGDPCLKAGCIEAGAGPWRGFPLRDFARPSEEQR